MLPQFDVSTYPSQIFWLAIVFLTLYFFIRWSISPAAEKIFVNRNAQIDNDTNLADEMTKKAKELKSLYDREIADTVTRAENIQKDLMDSLEKTFASQKASLSHKLNGQLKIALSEIAEAKTEFESQRQEASLDVAAVIIEKITTKQANTEILKQCYAKIR